MKNFGTKTVGVTCSSVEQMVALFTYARKREVPLAPNADKDVGKYFDRFPVITWNAEELWVDASKGKHHQELTDEEFCEMCDNWHSTGLENMKKEAELAHKEIDEFVGHRFDKDRFYALLGQYMLKHVEQERKENGSTLDFLKLIRDDKRLNFEEKLLLVYTLSKLPQSSQMMAFALGKGIKQEIADKFFPKN